MLHRPLGLPDAHRRVLVDARRGSRLFAYAAGTVKWQVTDAVWERDIVVTSAAAANAVPVAEYTVAMVLLANKGVLLFREWLRDPTAAVPLDPSTVGNYRRRVGLVGASLVGRHVIELLAPYDLEVAVYDPYLIAARRPCSSGSRRSTTSMSCVRRSTSVDPRARTSRRPGA